MSEGTKNIIAALILAIGMIAAVFIYVDSTRYDYSITWGGEKLKKDKWTGKEMIIDKETGKEIKK